MNSNPYKISNQNDILFNKHRFLYIAAFVIILLVGLAIRFYDLTEAPLDFHPTRQLFSAIKARGMFYENLDTAPEWQRDFAVEQWKIQGLIEPPIMERMAAFFYSLIGQEVLWIPRVLSIIFWTIGGVFLLLLTKMIADKNAAIFAFMLFMITPYTTIASRAFQPDPLMVSLMIIGLWGLVRWIEKENLSSAIIAGLFAGLAIFTKSVVIFPIAITFAAVIIFKKRSLISIVKDHTIWVMFVLTILPYVGYMIYGLAITGSLVSEFNLRFFPQLWIDPAFWLRWNEMITAVIGSVIFLSSIIGIFILRKPIHRIFLFSLFIGYFIYGMTLPYHISTHDYYQLPLVPIAIMGAAVVFSHVLSAIEQPRWYTNVVVIGVLLFYAANNAWDVRVTLKRNDYTNEVKFWQNMSELFSPQDSIIGITQDYGYRLTYWGWTKIENWMSSGDFSVRELAGQEFDMVELFEKETAGKDYFLVTQMSEFSSQPKIKQILMDNYQIIAETSDYIIFDLHQKIGD